MPGSYEVRRVRIGGASAAMEGRDPIAGVPMLDAHPGPGAVGKAEARNWDPSARLAVVLARSAAGLAGPGPERDRCGVVLGTCYGAMDSTVRYFDRYLMRGPRAVSPLQFAQAGAGVPAGVVALDLGWRGYHLTVCQGPESGAWAVVLAVMALRTGRASRLLAGGIDTSSRLRTGVTKDSRVGGAVMVLDVGQGPGGRIVGVGIGPGSAQAVEAAISDGGGIEPRSVWHDDDDRYGAAGTVFLLLRAAAERGPVAVCRRAGEKWAIAVILLGSMAEEM